MDEGDTPKKNVVESVESPSCFLCGLIVSSDERIKVFGKSLFDIAGVINSVLAIDVATVYSSRDLFVCTKKCYKRLTKYERIKKSLESLQDEIKDEFKKASALPTRTKRMLKESASNVNNNSVTSEDRTIRRNAAKCLKFSDSTSRTYPAETAELPCNFMKTHSNDHLSVCTRPPKPLLTSSPKANVTTVTVSIKNPSKTVNKTVKQDYNSIAKALVFGSPQRIAKAVVKCGLLKKSVVENVLNLVSTEVNGLCSRSKPSILRKCDQENITKFNFQSLFEEWKERSPVFYSFLLTCSNCKLMKTCSFLPSVALAGSVLLKQRNPHMNAMANTIGVLIKTASIEVWVYCRFIYLFHKHREWYIDA